jgi:hypothetical protein
MHPDFYWLIVGILAVWRLAHLLVAEAGPWDLCERMRRRWTGSMFHSLINCFYCLSFWISAPFAFFMDGAWQGRVLLWPALSAGAILIERVLHRETFASDPVYYEDQEESHVLRQEQDRESVQRV